jgi:hypothetical protein
MIATLAKNSYCSKKSCNPLSGSVSVRVSLEEKEMRVLANALALALTLTLTLFLYPERTIVASCWKDDSFFLYIREW